MEIEHLFYFSQTKYPPYLRADINTLRAQPRLDSVLMSFIPSVAWTVAFVQVQSMDAWQRSLPCRFETVYTR